jgi:hypothetical protein
MPKLYMNVYNLFLISEKKFKKFNVIKQQNIYN